MLISINKHFVDRYDKDDLFMRLHMHKFDRMDISIDELVGFIKQGYAFCAQFSGKRQKANFRVAGFLAVDIDGGLTLEQALADPFFVKYGAFIYTTCRHTPLAHRFRIVFELEEPIESRETMEGAYTGLVQQYGGDDACTDACRFFFGSTKAEVFIQGKKLPASVVEELVLRGGEEKVVTDYKGRDGHPASTETRVRIAPDTLIQLAGGGWTPFSEIPFGTTLHCPKHTDVHPSAFVTESMEGVKGIRCSTCNKTFFLDTGSHEPRRYDFQYGWENAVAVANENFEREVEIFEDRTGITYVPNNQDKGPSGYSPRVLNEFPFGSPSSLGINPVFIGVCERYIKAESIAIRYPQFMDDFMFDPANGVTMREALTRREKSGEFREDDLDFIVDEKAVLNWLRHEGVTLIKSPKGTGKTQLMQAIVQHYSEYDGMPKKILLIGHRRPLINATAKRLSTDDHKFVSYLNTDKDTDNPDEYNKPDTRYAICMDSLPNLLGNTRLHQYDVVIIDEVEQVLSHLLAPTMKDSRRDVILHLQHYLKTAKHVFLLDADLNVLTTDVIKTLMGDDVKDVFYVINTYKPESGQVYLYSSKDQMLGELEEALVRGERCFFCSNSKKLTHALHREITEKYQNIKSIEITGDNSSKPVSQHFINNIKEEILKYQFIAVSPSLGTGIDIKFDNDAELVDQVFGVFEAKVNTHFDIDQQLSRVRDPKRINVWISPQPFTFVTDRNLIELDIREMYDEFRTLKDIEPDGTKIYHDPDKVQVLYEGIYAAVKETRRASMNRLRDNFIELRKANGWKIIPVEDKTLASKGNTLKEDAMARSIQEKHEKILNAKVITDAEYKVIDKKKSDKRSEDEVNSKARYDIEKFYNMPVSKELLNVDDDWKLRNAIALYDLLCLDEGSVAEKDAVRRYRLFMDTKKLRLKAKTLRALLGAAGYYDYDNRRLDPAVEIDDSTLQPFIAACRVYEKELQNVFDMSLPDTFHEKPARMVGEILRNLLQLNHAYKRPAKNRPGGGGKIYLYKLNIDLLESLQRWHAQHKDQAKRDAWERERVSVVRFQSVEAPKRTPTPIELLTDVEYD